MVEGVGQDATDRHGKPRRIARQREQRALQVRQIPRARYHEPYRYFQLRETNYGCLF